MDTHGYTCPVQHVVLTTSTKLNFSPFERRLFIWPFTSDFAGELDLLNLSRFQKNQEVFGPKKIAFPTANTTSFPRKTLHHSDIRSFKYQYEPGQSPQSRVAPWNFCIQTCARRSHLNPHSLMVWRNLPLLCPAQGMRNYWLRSFPKPRSQHRTDVQTAIRLKSSIAKSSLAAASCSVDHPA